MIKFNRDSFEYSGGYLMYCGDCGEQQQFYSHDESVHPTRRGKAREMFVARFKYCGRDKPGFLSFLIRNFHVEEYFARMAAGETPAGILQSKGYVSLTVRKAGLG